MTSFKSGLSYGTAGAKIKIDFLPATTDTKKKSNFRSTECNEKIHGEIP